jgi:hypothetical protein
VGQSTSTRLVDVFFLIVYGICGFFRATFGKIAIINIKLPRAAKVEVATIAVEQRIHWWPFSHLLPSLRSQPF